MTGLIAFFDILGYQSFLKKNSASESALKVLDMIREIPPTIDKVLSEQTRSEPELCEEMKQASKNLRHLIFSDTIVLFLAYPANAIPYWKGAALVYLSMFSANLCSTMFTEGLPVRGAIDEGDFIFKDMCFAGQAVVNAYELSQSLEFSGLVYNQKFTDRLPGVFQGSKASSHVSYLSPLKTGEQQ